MTKGKTTATGPKPLPKTHHERQLSSGEVGVQLILLKTCYSSTTTINGVEQRYIHTSTAQSTGTSSTKILCPQQLTIAYLKLWINEELAQGNREQINWSDYIIKEEMLNSLSSTFKSLFLKAYEALKWLLIERIWPTCCD